MIFTVTQPDGTTSTQSCGHGLGIPLDTMHPGDALAGVVMACTNPGPGHVTIVTTSLQTPATAPPFVAGAAAVPAPHEWCGAYFAPG